jgi:eukaryotic-like serine/threonine-protein kinase
VPKVCPHCRTEYDSEQTVCPNDGATLSDPSLPVDLLVGQLLADRYRIIRTLGEGGMGRVYLGEHVRMGRLSAVKVMHPSLAPTEDAIGRFNREAANASRINHPNVASIYDFGETKDGVLYLAMEYVEGETLAALSRRVGPLPLPHAGDLVRQIADGLHAAHQLGIVHRDLKPDNILITKDADGHDRVKIVDFGIAKTMRGGGQTVTTAGMSIGTPEFMSPEQLAGEVLDARTDIYSLGLVVFTMLTGELAYPDLTSKQSLVQRLTARPRPLVEARPHIVWPARLQSALDKALSPEPADRFAKVSDFAKEVSAATGAIPEIGQVKTRAMTPLAVRSIAPTEEKTPGSNTKMRFAAVGAGVLVAACIGVLGIRQLSSKTTPAAVPAVASPSPVQPVAQLPVTVDSQLNSPTVQLAASVPNVSRVPKRDSVAVAKKHDSVTKTTVVPVTQFDSTSSALAASALRAGRHTWLRASGDSAEPAAGGSSISSEAREVMGHISRARRLFKNNQPNKAGPELRTAGEELRMFAADHPGASETMLLRTQLSSTVQEALAQCEQARDASSEARPKMCDGLEKAAAAFPQPMRQGIAPFRRGGRRPGALAQPAP